MTDRNPMSTFKKVSKTIGPYMRDYLDTWPAPKLPEDKHSCFTAAVRNFDYAVEESLEGDCLTLDQMAHRLRAIKRGKSRKQKRR